jgi:hypothetical protein
MTTTRTATPTTTASLAAASPLLIRRVDDIEIPAPGIWPLMLASHVAISPARNASPVAATIHGGQLVVTPAVEDCTVHVALCDTGGFRLSAQALEVAATSYGTVQWTVAGDAICGTDSAPTSLSLAYHGITRRAHRAWAWFTGAGHITPSDEESREVILDLLFEAPTSLARDPS